MKIDYSEIRMWIDNDESLYTWWKSSRLPISKFIKENNAELRQIIKRAVGGNFYE